MLIVDGAVALYLPIEIFVFVEFVLKIYDFYLFFCYTLQVMEESRNNSSDSLSNCTADDDAVSSSTTQVTQDILDHGTGKLRRRSRSSSVPRNGSFVDSRARPRLYLRCVKSASPQCDEVFCLQPAGNVSDLQNSLSALRHGCCIEGTRDTTEGLPGIEQALLSECRDTPLFPYAKSFSPQCSSFHHSTPDDKDSAVALHMMTTVESESICLSKDDCPYEDIDMSVLVRNSLSWHESGNMEPSPSRSCVSVDDSLFLRDLNVDGSNETELLATCTAVSNLEQLEQEVAGVLSDCGDLQQCVGMLRRRDSVKAVVGRYSLGVADSVLASDKCARWQDSAESAIVDELSLSSSVGGIVRHSGFLWDEDGFDTHSPGSGFVPVGCRVTRSLSPLPAIRQQQADCRASLGAYADARLSGKVVACTDIDNNTSTDLAPCSVYDVNRRLSGRLHVQHVND